MAPESFQADGKTQDDCLHEASDVASSEIQVGMLAHDTNATSLDIPSLSMYMTADFRSNGAAVEGEERSGPCCAEMRQEDLTALLLRQQHEMLKELRDQKQELRLSKANRDEISHLVHCSIKHHLQLNRGTPSLIERRSGKTRGKRIKHIRRRRKLSQLVEKRKAKHNSVVNTNLSESRSSSSTNHGDTRSPSLPLGDTWCYEGSTVIHQRVEQQSPQMEVSVDGLWLPALPTLSPKSGGGVQEQQHQTARWAEKSINAAETASCDTQPSPGLRNAGLRPSTVASRVPSNCANNSIPATGGRGGAVTAGSARNAEVKVGKAQSLSHLPRVGDEAEGLRRGYKRPLRDSTARHYIPAEGPSEEQDGAAAMSEHTAAMLERSRALVARAKACCGYVRRSTGPDLNGEGGGPDNCSVGVRGDASSQGNVVLGQAGSILFPSLSFTALDQVGLEKQSPHSPLISPEIQSFELGSTGGARGDADLGIREKQEQAKFDAVKKTVEEVPQYKPTQSEEAKCVDSSPDKTVSTQARRCSRDLRGSGGVLASVTESVTMLDVSMNIPVSGIGSDPRKLHSDEKGGAVTIDVTQTRPVMPPADSTRDSLNNATTHDSRPDTMVISARRDEPRRCHSRRRSRKQVGGEGDTVSTDNPAKIDVEWENEIAKNILSLYETKLKAELREKRGITEDDLGRELRSYLTAEEEEREAALHEHDDRRKRRSRPGHDTHSPTRNKTDVHGPSSTSPQRVRTGRPATSMVRSRNNEHSFSKTATLTKMPRQHHSGGGSDGDKYKLDDSGPEKASGLGSSAAGSRRISDAGGKPRALSPVEEKQSTGNTSCRGAGRSGVDPHPRPSTVSVFSSSRVKLTDGRGSERNASATAGAGVTGRGGFRGTRTISIPTRGGGEAVVVVPKRPNPIWFAGSGAVQAEWSALPGGARIVRDLEGLEEQGRYTKYVAVVEGLLAAHLRADDQRGPTELVKRLWRQLVVTCTAFGVRSTENKRFERALELLKRADTLLSRQVLDKQASFELRAFVFDAYGLYYLRRGRSSAALDYVQKAMVTHSRMQDWGHVTKCHLHSAVILSRLNRHDEALRCLGQVLAMVQEGKLDVGGNSPQKLCLVAICYHNIAVEQLILRHVGEACMSSQNARRLARLCLSYSNRWLHSFEGTHKLALAELARVLPTPSGGGRNATRLRGFQSEGGEQQELLKRLTEELFS